MRKVFNYFFLQIIHGGYLDLRPVPVHLVLDFKGHLVPNSGSYLRKKEFRRNSSEYLSTENHLTCSHSPQVSVHQPFLIIRNQLWLQTDGTTQLHFITFSCFIWWQPSHFIITRRTKKKVFNSVRYSCPSVLYHFIGALLWIYSYALPSVTPSWWKESCLFRCIYDNTFFFSCCS